MFRRILITVLWALSWRARGPGYIEITLSLTVSHIATAQLTPATSVPSDTLTHRRDDQIIMVFCKHAVCVVCVQKEQLSEIETVRRERDEGEAHWRGGDR